MSLHLPAGKKVAVAIGADFDASALWKGVFDRTSPSYLSRGEFGAEVGVPRLLELFARYGPLQPEDARRCSPRRSAADLLTPCLGRQGTRLYPTWHPRTRS